MLALEENRKSHMARHARDYTNVELLLNCVVSDYILCCVRLSNCIGVRLHRFRFQKLGKRSNTLLFVKFLYNIRCQDVRRRCWSVAGENMARFLGAQ